MKNKELRIKYQLSDDISELRAEDRELMRRAREALKGAYAPYSGFQVGAAVRLANGEIFIGSNQENASLPAGLCAERVALYAANAAYPDVAVEALAISVHNPKEPHLQPATPCGPCRQVLEEAEQRFGREFPIILGADGNDLLIVPSAGSLLPLAFRADFLKKDRPS